MRALAWELPLSVAILALILMFLITAATALLQCLMRLPIVLCCDEDAYHLLLYTFMHCIFHNVLILKRALVCIVFSHSMSVAILAQQQGDLTSPWGLGHLSPWQDER